MNTLKTFVPTYLYIKQHTITGKLYFGKTIKNPEKYIGSGTYWLRHINKHGRVHVDTLWYCLFHDQESCIEFALMFSKQENIVKSSNWANVIEETGIDNSYLEDTSWLSEKTKNYHNSLTNAGRVDLNDKIKKGIKKFFDNMSEEEKEKRAKILSESGKKQKGKIGKGLGRKTYKRIEYEKDMSCCKECNKPLEFNKRNNDYCSKKCANIVIGRNTKAIGGHETQKLAVSKTFKGKKRGNQSTDHKAKIIESRRNNGKCNHSEETKCKMSNTRLGMRCITNGILNKRVKDDKLEEFLNNGWVIGRTFL